MNILFSLILLFSAPHPLCMVLDTVNPGQIVEWDAAHETWVGLPEDLRPSVWIFLTDPYLPDEQVQALDFYTSASTGEIWLFPLWSLRYSDGGNHDLCQVRKFIR